MRKNFKLIVILMGFMIIALCVFYIISGNQSDKEETTTLPEEITTNKEETTTLLEEITNDKEETTKDEKQTTPDNTIVIKEFSELIEYEEQLGDDLQFYYIHYYGQDMTKEEIENEVLKIGLEPIYDGCDKISYEDGVLCFVIANCIRTEYFNSVDALNDYIKNNGYESVEGKRIAVKVDEMILNSEVRNAEFMFAVGFYSDVKEHRLFDGHMIIELGELKQEVYVSRNVEEFREDIKAVETKDTFNDAIFYYRDGNGNFNSEYESLDDLIAATGCKVEVCEHYYNHDIIRVITLRKVKE